MTSAGEVWQQFLHKQHEPEYMRNVLIGLASVMGILTLPLVICTFVVAGTAAAGFNAVLTGVLLLLWEAGSIFLMQRGPGAMSHGFLIGTSVVMLAITFLTAVYWGQLAQCDTSVNGTLSMYSCSRISAMRGVCAFAVLVWLLQLPFVILTILHRNTIIGGVDYDNHGTAHNAGSSGTNNSTHVRTATADKLGTSSDFAYDHTPADPYRYSFTGATAANTSSSFTGAPTSAMTSASSTGNKQGSTVYEL